MSDDDKPLGFNIFGLSHLSNLRRRNQQRAQTVNTLNQVDDLQRVRHELHVLANRLYATFLSLQDAQQDLNLTSLPESLELYAPEHNRALQHLTTAQQEVEAAINQVKNLRGAAHQTQQRLERDLRSQD